MTPAIEVHSLRYAYPDGKEALKGISFSVEEEECQSEYDKVLDHLHALQMENGWAQEYEASEYYKPEFEDRQRPFKGGSDNSD